MAILSLLGGVNAKYIFPSEPCNDMRVRWVDIVACLPRDSSRCVAKWDRVSLEGHVLPVVVIQRSKH